MIKRTDRNLRIMLLFCYDWHDGMSGRLYRCGCRIRQYMQTFRPEALVMYNSLMHSTLDEYRRSELYTRLEDSCLPAKDQK